MTAHDKRPQSEPALFGNLLDEHLLHYRRIDTGERVATNLPELFVAMAQDLVRDFPALRPHQRHPWHAFLVQLAAIALHHAQRDGPFDTADAWRDALLALTPDDPDGAAWCLVSPANRPAFMQAPEPSGSLAAWKKTLAASDELDMLVTSKNHDLKVCRMSKSTTEDWIYALISLQTQEGFLGSGNYGISRMNGGFASRCGVGVMPPGGWSRRWLRDLQVLQRDRTSVVEQFDFNKRDALCLVWLLPWDGNTSLAFTSLGPWYIEICRRVRLIRIPVLSAKTIGSNAPRIAAKDLKGATGDPWMPVDVAHAKALTIGRRGFDYELASELLLGRQYSKPAAQQWLPSDDADGVQLLAQGVARGKGKTEGYHERRIAISKKIRQALLIRHTDELAKLAEQRIEVISEIRKMLWSALTTLLSNGAKDESGKDKATDTVKDRAGLFAQPFESRCDANFFSDLIEEVESEDPVAARQTWLLSLAHQAEHTLKAAFQAGPRNGQLRYRAQSQALNRLRSAMRSDKSKLPALAQALRQQTPTLNEDRHEHA